MSSVYKGERHECPECEGTGYIEQCCPLCGGCGEGMYDGARCYSCRGSGSEYEECAYCEVTGWMTTKEYIEYLEAKVEALSS